MNSYHYQDDGDDSLFEPCSSYYSTGGSYRPPRKPKNHSWMLAAVGCILLFIVGTGMARSYVFRLVTEAEQEEQSGQNNADHDTLSAISEKTASDVQEAAANIGDTDQQSQIETPVNASQEAPANALQNAAEHGAELEISGETGKELTLQEIYKKVIPSVVSITAEWSGSKSTGTGIIMSSDGYIITNYHVAAEAQKITVLLDSGDEAEAEIVGGDEVSDLMVLKISSTDLTPAEFGDSDAVEVGDSVVAIGDPLGIELRGTMTDGIICGISRDIEVDGRTMTLIQTNAALNSGNSGGPLVNMQGQVIGINAMKFSNYASMSSNVEGIGFAIPISGAKSVIDELISQGYVTGRPACGFSISTLDTRILYYYNLPGTICVSEVDENSDASRQGIQKGDVILAVDGQKVSTIDDFNEIKNSHTAGDSMELSIYRNGTIQTITIELMDQSETTIS